METVAQLKSVFTFREACQHIGCSESYMRKLTHWKAIPYSRPRNGKIYFSREQLDAWMLQNPMPVDQRINQDEQLDSEAVAHVTTNK